MQRLQLLWRVSLPAMLVLLSACADQQPFGQNQKTLTDNTKPEGYIIRDAGGKLQSSAVDSILPSQAHAGLEPSHVRGARIYDDFTIELAATVPGPNPLLALANEPTAGVTDTDSWRCSQCHGFDYEGGVFTFNNGATNNLLEIVYDVRWRDEGYIADFLFTGFDAWDGTAVVNVHNYSTLLTPQAIVDVSDFVANELYDTHMYVRAASNGSLGDHMNGMALYNSVPPVNGAIPPIIRVNGANFNCVDCHGADGLLVAGVDLYNVAWTDPFMFMHRVLFGSPRDLATFPDITAEDMTVMPGLYETVLTDGLHFGGPEQGADAMAHVQTNFTAAAGGGTPPAAGGGGGAAAGP